MLLQLSHGNNQYIMINFYDERLLIKYAFPNNMKQNKVKNIQ